ncbi:MAG: plastocyanin/azurin family copper-binding protein [Labilithrix sp.]
MARRSLAVAAAVGLVVVACSDDPAPPPPVGAALGEACAADHECVSQYCDLEKKLCSAIASVDAAGKGFAPADVSIRVGETVRWNFLGGDHNVVSGDGCTADGKFRSGAPQKSGNYVRRFDVEGDFPYFCETHCDDGMKGVVRVAK